MMKKIYIVLFAILYCAVAIISCTHAFEFFSLANTPIMAAVLSGAFEIGQAAVLFSLLTNAKERNKVMPWVLMTILTLVQVLGNVYSSYKYILQNSMDNLKFFKDPIFVWTNLPDAQANVIVTYLVGALLPIIALLLTSMVVNQLGKDDETKEVEQKEQENKKIEEKFEEVKEENQKEVEQTFPQLIVKNTPIVHEFPIESGIEVPKLAEPLEFAINNEESKINELEEDYKEPEEESTKIEEEQPIPEEIDNLFDGPIEQNLSEFSQQQSNKKKSHFINI